MPLKAYFCFSYFAMAYVTLSDMIAAEEERYD